MNASEISKHGNFECALLERIFFVKKESLPKCSLLSTVLLTTLIRASLNFLFHHFLNIIILFTIKKLVDHVT